MILVTGGTGLVGSHLLFKLVQQNESVRAIIRKKEKIEKVKKVFSFYSNDSDALIQKIEWVKGDMLDLYSLEEAFVGIRQVYHCAAEVSFDGREKNLIINANVQGTENVVNQCLRHKIEKLCHVSSIASLGESLNGEFIDENAKWSSTKNRSSYAVSKYKSEMEVWRGIQEGLNAVIVNPSVILGPGFWNAGIGSLFVKAAKGMKYYTQGETGFVDVRDVVDCMIRLMQSPINAERFVLNSENLGYKQLFYLLANEMKVDKPKYEATKNKLTFAVFLDFIANKLNIKKREITYDIIRASLSKSKYSNKKINEAINPTWISIETSVRDITKKFSKELTIS